MQTKEIKRKRLIVIGGGAAGFFAAINAAKLNPELEVCILEKTNKLLSKVRISGGGRCNVTNATFDHAELVRNYPRGQKELRQVFARFDVSSTFDWFEQHGVQLKTEHDGRVFPVSDSSETVVSCFLGLAAELGIRIELQAEVFAIRKSDNGLEIKTQKGVFQADALICSCGGFAKGASYDFLRNTGHRIVQPIPSLFTFNLPGEKILGLLQGVSVGRARVSLSDAGCSQTGPVLVTHWGLSGPAVLKLSAFAAHELHRCGYNAKIEVNWLGEVTQEETVQRLKVLQKNKHKASPFTTPLENIPRRLWEYLCLCAGIVESRTWSETPKQQIALLAQQLCRSEYQMQGKTTFKEEFVNCGGVELREVDFKTMQSKKLSGLYFCGEVLNIDGITGGFNFQNAWSTAWICAQSISV